ncbi:MAG: PadR family transcriptional regulator [Gemmatimonadetes bacterium]|nr:MAG: PadR family transcriptional regulator [Gemmatimonadota bacterium]
MRCLGDFDFDFDAFVFGPRRRRRRRRVRWRVFERGDLKFVILQVLSERPMHGYDVMKALEEESGGMYRPSPGSVYPTLQMLEDEGFVRGVEEEGKRVYHITDRGREYLEEHAHVVEDVFDRVEHFTDRLFGDDMRRLSGAFRRLAKAAFDEALRLGPDEEVLSEIVDVIEEAATRVEGIRTAAREARRARRSGGAAGRGGDDRSEASPPEGGTDSENAAGTEAGEDA